MFRVFPWVSKMPSVLLNQKKLFRAFRLKAKKMYCRGQWKHNIFKWEDAPSLSKSLKLTSLRRSSIVTWLRDTISGESANRTKL